MKYRHYAPNAPLILLSGSDERVLRFLRFAQEEEACAILCYDEELPYLQDHLLFPIGEREDLATQAHLLFSALRCADRTDAEVVYAHLPPMDGLGLALYNRMIRAAAHTVKHLD